MSVTALLTSRATRAVAFAIAVIAATAVRGAPIGSEFQVNTTTAHATLNSVASDDQGGFVVVWESFEAGQDDSGYDILARRFDSAGDPIGGDFQVNSYTPGHQKVPSVAMDSDGDFVVVWMGNTPSVQYRMFGQRFSSSGAPLGEEFQVAASTVGGETNGNVEMNGPGDFVVAWDSGDGDDQGVIARRFASDGTPLAGEFVVNSHTIGRQYNSRLDMTRGGDWIAAWLQAPQDPAADEIFAQRFASTGDRVGGQFRVNTHTLGMQRNPAPALNASGSFVIVWHANDDLQGRRFSSSGSPIGGDFQVNVYTTYLQCCFGIAADDAGHFVIAWSHRALPDRIVAQRFSRQGARVSAELQVNVDTGFSQREPRLAMKPDGDFVVAWSTNRGLQGDLWVNRARRFATPRLDLDYDAFASPLTDGVMLLRWLFGFRDEALVTGALGDCFRCDPAEVEAYLASIEPWLDVDGSGDLRPLTDGLLVARHLFGFTDTALVDGAVDLDDCTRCEPEEIADWIAALAN